MCLDVWKCPPVSLEFKLLVPNFEVELLVKHKKVVLHVRVLSSNEIGEENHSFG